MWPNNCNLSARILCISGVVNTEQTSRLEAVLIARVLLCDQDLFHKKIKPEVERLAREHGHHHGASAEDDSLFAVVDKVREDVGGGGSVGGLYLGLD